MNILAVDDEQFALKDLQSAIMEVLPGVTLSCFDTATDAVEYAKTAQIDVAFLDINMGGMNGLQLAKHLKDIYGNTNIVFVTGYREYALDSYKVNASDYIMKPVTKEAVKEALENLRSPVQINSDKRMRVQAFGNFDVFADNKPLSFARTKTKELLAYLIYREGALCGNNEIISVLWEDKKDSQSLQGYFRDLVADLTNTLKQAGFPDLVIKQRGAIAIAMDKLQCDFSDFNSGKHVNSYKGEFMAQYSWAEFTNAFLSRTSR
jgi:two-component SAPR family response regulator